MTLIIKEKAIFVFTGSQWLNLAQAKSITPDGDRITICWADEKYQGFNPIESKAILTCLQELCR